MPKLAAINGHPSLLPHYRGPSPVSWAIRNGETEIGYTWHRMDAELDTGPILAQGSVTLEDEHSWEELEPKLVPVVVELLTDALARVEVGDPGDPQERGAGDYFPFFGDDYVWIDPSSSRAEVYRQVKAWRFASATDGLRGALAELDGETVRVLRTSFDPGGRARDGVRETAHSGSWRASPHEAGHRRHVVRAGRALGRVAPSRCARPARVRRCDRARRRSRSRHPACRDRRRGDSRRARRDRVLGWCGRRSGTLRGRRSSGDGHATDASRRGRAGAAAGGARTGPAHARDLPRLPAAERRAWRRPRPAPARGGRERRSQAGARGVRGASGGGEGGIAACGASSARARR